VYLLSGVVFAEVLNVPNDYPTIQSAVSNASDGDEIIVAPGTYVLPPTQLNITKSIQLHSSDGSEKTFITATGDGYYGGRIHFSPGSDGSSVEGFTFTSFPSQSMSLHFEAMTGFSVRDCRFTLHAGGYNSCLATNWANNGLVENCIFEDNGTRAIFLDTSEGITVKNCLISDNHFPGSDDGGGIKSQFGSGPLLINTVVCGNTPNQIDGPWTDGGGNTILDECPLVIWTVDDDGNADFDNIQAAVDAASDGDEIVVMPGTYTNTADEVVNMRGKPVTLRSSDPSDPNVVAATIIDGEGVRRGILCKNGETNQTIIEGVTIQNCSASWYDWNDNNQTEYWEFFGGGMWNRDGSSPSVTSCNFINNIAEYGGGMYNGDENAVESNPVLTGCLFLENSTNANNGVGGGMYNFTSSPTLTHCDFIGNTAYYGGGMLNWESSNPLLTDCSFTGNSVGGDGGGIYNTQSMPTFTNCVFDENNAIDGGGVFNAEPSSSANVPIFQNCTFTENIASSQGGGMHNFSISPVLIHCTFQGNNAGAGGAILSWNSSLPSILDSLICGNTPNQISGPWNDKGENEIADECSSDCPDIDGDALVGVTDILVIIDQWGLTNSPADVNQDGIVNVSDILIVVGNWGPCE
jgi:parallel beta-helix repeat protein/predicted outer membrane repeat protein